MQEKIAAIRTVIREMAQKFDDPNIQKMLRYMGMALTAIQLFIQYGGML